MTADEIVRAGLLPVPDPTTLTTAALAREVKNLHEKMEDAIDGLAKTLQTAIEHRGELMDARLETVNLQFTLIENARLEQKSDTKQAVVDALAAQKEANAKSELVMTEATGQLRSSVAASTESDRRAAGDMKDRITVVEGRLNGLSGNPLKERVVAVEGRTQGAKENQTAIYAGLAAFIGVIAFAMAVAAMFAK